MSCWARSLLCYLQKIWLRQKPRALTGTNSMLSITATCTAVTDIALKMICIRQQVTEDHKLWQKKSKQVWEEDSQSRTTIPAEASQYTSQQQWRLLYIHMLVQMAPPNAYNIKCNCSKYALCPTGKLAVGATSETCCRISDRSYKATYMCCSCVSHLCIWLC